MLRTAGKDLRIQSVAALGFFAYTRHAVTRHGLIRHGLTRHGLSKPFVYSVVFHHQMLWLTVGRMLQIGRNLLAEAFEVARVMTCNHRIQKVHAVGRARQFHLHLVATIRMLVFDRCSRERIAKGIE